MTATAGKPARKPAAPKKKGAAARAARAEVTAPDTVRTVTFRDATLTLPATLPGTVAFDLAEISHADGDPMAVFRLLRSVLGPEQFTMVRDRITPDDADLVAVVDALMGDIFDQYGTNLGE